MEFRLFKCSDCGHFLGKCRLIKTDQKPVFCLEIRLYCKNFKKCKLARDPAKNGENIIDIATK